MDRSELALERTMANRDKGGWIVEDGDDLDAMLTRKNVIKLVMDIDLDDPSCLKEVAPQIKEITFRGLMIKNIDYIRLLINLEQISVRDTDVRRITGLNDLFSLKWLDIVHNQNLTNLDNALRVPNLETIIMTHNTKLPSLPKLYAPKLTRLVFRGNTVKKNDDILDNIDAPCLEDIDLSYMDFNDLLGLRRFDHLSKLSLRGNNITALKHVDFCGNLTTLDVADNPLSDISALSKLKHLKLLVIDSELEKKHPELRKKYEIRHPALIG